MLHELANGFWFCCLFVGVRWEPELHHFNYIILFL